MKRRLKSFLIGDCNQPVSRSRRRNDTLLPSAFISLTSCKQAATVEDLTMVQVRFPDPKMYYAKTLLFCSQTYVHKCSPECFGPLKKKASTWKRCYHSETVKHVEICTS